MNVVDFERRGLCPTCMGEAYMLGGVERRCPHCAGEGIEVTRARRGCLRCKGEHNDPWHECRAPVMDFGVEEVIR